MSIDVLKAMLPLMRVLQKVTVNIIWSFLNFQVVFLQRARDYNTIA